MGQFSDMSDEDLRELIIETEAEFLARVKYNRSVLSIKDRVAQAFREGLTEIALRLAFEEAIANAKKKGLV